HRISSECCLVGTGKDDQVVTMNDLIRPFVAQKRLDMRRLLATNRLEFSSAVIDQPLGEVVRCHIDTDHRITKAKIARYFNDTSRQEAFAMGREGNFRAVVHDDFPSRFERIANPALAAWQ